MDLEVGEFNPINLKNNKSKCLTSQDRFYRNLMSQHWTIPAVFGIESGGN